MSNQPHESPVDLFKDAARDAARDPGVRRAAAAAAVGAGAAAAKVTLDLRSAAHAPERDREFALHPGEPLAPGLRRVARGQIDTVVELLTPANGALSDHAVHEARKALKRLRAMTRMLRDELGPRRYERENAALRDAGQRLAGARDAEVMVDTLERVIEEDLRGPISPGLAALRGELIVDRQIAEERLLNDAGTVHQAADDVRAVRGRAARWVSADAGFGAVAPSLERLYRQGRRRMRQALSAPTMENLHEWRKRVKDLRHAAEILGPSGSKRLRKVARRADRLGELLGEDHDLAVLGDLVAARGELFARPSDHERLLRAIERRRARLKRSALKRGRRLYGVKPRSFAAGVARDWRGRPA